MDAITNESRGARGIPNEPGRKRRGTRYSHSNRITIQSIRVPSTKNRRIPLDSETSALTDSNIWRFLLIAEHTCSQEYNTYTNVCLYHTSAIQVWILEHRRTNFYLSINVSRRICLDIDKLLQKKPIIEIS